MLYQYFIPQKCSNRANMCQLLLLRFNHYMLKHFSEVLAPSNHLWPLSSPLKVLEETCQTGCRWASSPQQHNNVFKCAKYTISTDRLLLGRAGGDSQKLVQSWKSTNVLTTYFTAKAIDAKLDSIPTLQYWDLSCYAILCVSINLAKTAWHVIYTTKNNDANTRSRFW